jgi:hypothetical protein
MSWFPQRGSPLTVRLSFVPDGAPYLSCRPEGVNPFGPSRDLSYSMERYRGFYERPESHLSRKRLTLMTVMSVPRLGPRLTHSRNLSHSPRLGGRISRCFGGAAYLQIDLCGNRNMSES